MCLFKLDFKHPFKLHLGHIKLELTQKIKPMNHIRNPSLDFKSNPLKLDFKCPIRFYIATLNPLMKRLIYQ